MKVRAARRGPRMKGRPIVMVPRSRGGGDAVPGWPYLDFPWATSLSTPGTPTDGLFPAACSSWLLSDRKLS